MSWLCILLSLLLKALKLEIYFTISHRHENPMYMLNYFGDVKYKIKFEDESKTQSFAVTDTAQELRLRTINSVST